MGKKTCYRIIYHEIIHVNVIHFPLVLCNVGDGFLKTFFEKTKTMSPDKRADFLEEDDVSHFVSFLNDAHYC